MVRNELSSPVRCPLCQAVEALPASPGEVTRCPECGVEHAPRVHAPVAPPLFCALVGTAWLCFAVWVVLGDALSFAVAVAVLCAAMVTGGFLLIARLLRYFTGR
jgi:hypothetical protein